MKPTRKLSRRSFLGTVAGGSVAGAAAIVLASTGAEAQTSDSDSGRNADPSGHGRTGVTDNDSGPGSDSPGTAAVRAGLARGSPTATAAGAPILPANGRGRRSGLTDSDTGRGADSPGNGRGRRACTDSDTGRYSDQPGRCRPAAQIEARDRRVGGVASLQPIERL